MIIENDKYVDVIVRIYGGDIRKQQQIVDKFLKAGGLTKEEKTEIINLLNHLSNLMLTIEEQKPEQYVLAEK